MFWADPNENERRRNPRFSCGGRATIYTLPHDGILFNGILRNLSAGGICLKLSQALKTGMRTEVVVKVNAFSFRAAALVKGGGDPSTTSLEFLELSSGGKDALEEALDGLARLHGLNRKLRADHMDSQTQHAIAESVQSRRLSSGNARLMVAAAGNEVKPAGVIVGSVPDEKPESRIVSVRTALIGVDLLV